MKGAHWASGGRTALSESRQRCAGRHRVVHNQIGCARSRTNAARWISQRGEVFAKDGLS